MAIHASYECPRTVQAIETDVLRTLGLVRGASDPYCLPVVADHLYRAYLQDRTDTRVYEYLVPVVVKNVKTAIARGGQRWPDSDDLIQDIALKLCRRIGRLDPSRSHSLYSYATATAQWALQGSGQTNPSPLTQLLDEADEEDLPQTDDSAAHGLADIVRWFEGRQRRESSGTALRILGGLLSVIQTRPGAVSDRSSLVAEVARQVRLPQELVETNLNRWITSYLAGDAP